MSTVETDYKHIVLDERQVPVIAGTRIKVIEVVLDKIAYGWSPEEIHLQHPHLSLGQIHSALAYYWDHKTELDNVIEQDFQYAEQLRKTSQPTPFQRRLREQGLLP